MKVAVTGPAGYVGVNLVRLLLQRGHHVVAIDLKDFDRIAHPNLTAVRADILDTAAVRTALDGVEIVYHLAAVITMARRDDLAWRINTGGVRSVARSGAGGGRAQNGALQLSKCLRPPPPTVTSGPTHVTASQVRQPELAMATAEVAPLYEHRKSDRWA